MTRKLVLTAFLATMTFAIRARAEGVKHVVLVLEPGADVAEGEVARAIATELGAPVEVGGKPGPDADILNVSSHDGTLTVTLIHQHKCITF